MSKTVETIVTKVVVVIGIVVAALFVMDHMHYTGYEYTNWQDTPIEVTGTALSTVRSFITHDELGLNAAMNCEDVTWNFEIED